MQFQVPQFIETEDKIIGPLTLRQFLYVVGAGGLSFILFFTVEMWLWILLSIFLMAISLSLAFVKIGGRSLIHIGLSAFGFYWRPQAYVWQPEHPEVQKNKESMQAVAKPGSSIEDIISGLALKNVWRNLQTGTKTSAKQFTGKLEERYEVFQRLSGERRAARRVDYR